MGNVAKYQHGWNMTFTVVELLMIIPKSTYLSISLPYFSIYHFFSLTLYKHPHKKVKAMKQQKLFHLVLSAILIVCTTGCYDKDEIKDAEKYLFKDIQYSFEEEGDGFSTYDVELLPFIMENNLNSSITTTNSPFEDTWQETTFQSNDPGAFAWMGEEDIFVNAPYMFGDELSLSGTTIKYGSETTKAKGPNSSTSTISIPPHCRLIIKGTLHYSKLVATYTLTFVGEYTKTEKQIKGKFIQTTPESYTGDITMEPITAD